jgi:hypothetical protein
LLTVYSGTGATCATNGDCPVGTCDGALGRCVTQTNLDTGWTGLAHGADVTNGVAIQANLDCGGTGPACGECTITGVNPGPGNCRCENDNRNACNEPLQPDADDCGGAVCNCYVGPPLALSSGNVAACVVNKLAQDLSGTANVDTGDAESALHLRSVVYLGEDNYTPCPFCGGTCTAPAGKVGTPCGPDDDCDTSIGSGDGVCGNFDPVASDGARDGTCARGPNAGQSCDVDAINETFPAAGGGGHSLDCFPSDGKNVSGTGLKIDITQSTGTQSLTAAVPCGPIPAIPLTCHCGVCSGDTTIPCSGDQVCADAAAGTCVKGGTPPKPDGCVEACIDNGDGLTGACTGGEAGGPIDKYCDGIVRANGRGFIQCLDDSACLITNIGKDAGTCSISELRSCFLPTITATGTPDPVTPVGVGVFCIAPTASAGINSAAGLPGPGRLYNQGVVAYLCQNGAYQTGVGCP